VGKHVKKILTDEKSKRVIGVQMDNKENTVIKAKNVICACNFINAAEKLLPPSFSENPEYKYFREKTSICPGTLFIFLGFNIFHLNNDRV